MRRSSKGRKFARSVMPGSQIRLGDRTDPVPFREIDKEPDLDPVPREERKVEHRFASGSHLTGEGLDEPGKSRIEKVQ
jgi:hypothetical protein